MGLGQNPPVARNGIRARATYALPIWLTLTDTDRHPHSSAACRGTVAGMIRAAPDSPRLLLTSRQTAEALAISQRTLWALTRRGELRPIRVGGRGLSARALRYPVAELERWIAAQAAGDAS